MDELRYITGKSEKKKRNEKKQLLDSLAQSNPSRNLLAVSGVILSHCETLRGQRRGYGDWKGLLDWDSQKGTDNHCQVQHRCKCSVSMGAIRTFLRPAFLSRGPCLVPVRIPPRPAPNNLRSLDHDGRRLTGRKEEQGCWELSKPEGRPTSNRWRAIMKHY